MNPTDFTGTTDPMVAKNWIKSVEVIFRFMDLDGADRVRCATYLLKDDALLWKFEQGCHFVPMIADNPKEKLRHFIDGLRPILRRDVSVVDPKSYADAMIRALRAEQDQKDIEVDRQNKRSCPTTYHQQPQQRNKREATEPRKGQEEWS
ncbi:hypothetical protein ZIOFF_031622 [Zingiber officinale]|uniref:Uncharacterized protein n=1 Tax=Zingiber officinale TaxID=94328 RepID=A0A8J5L0F9_ZINOF|nr:hypothetical protein ZIOFF_031622 [Zingiber officinale]